VNPANRKEVNRNSQEEGVPAKKRLQNRDPRMFRMIPIQPHDRVTKLDYQDRIVPEKTQYWDLIAWITVFVIVWILIYYFVFTETATNAVR
jgi:hypothetical protein